MRKSEKLQTPAATHSFQGNTLYRYKNHIIKAYIRAATHLFERKTVYRDSRIHEKQMHNAATHHFKRKNLCRGKREKILRREQEREKKR